MARKKDTPQKAALREMMGNYLKENNVKVKDGTDVNSIMRDIDVHHPGRRSGSGNGMKNWDILSMIIATKKRIIPEMVIPKRPCIPAMAIWRLISPGIGKVSLNHRSSKNIRIQLLRTWRKRSFPLYAKGMTTNDIESHMRELYDIQISDSTISRITDKILPIVKEWQERPLEEIYAVVFMDAIHYHVRNEGRIVKRAVYIAIGIDMEGT